MDARTATPEVTVSEYQFLIDGNRVSYTAETEDEARSIAEGQNPGSCIILWNVIPFYRLAKFSEERH